MDRQWIRTDLGVWQAVWSECGLYSLEFPEDIPFIEKQLNLQQQSLDEQLTLYCMGEYCNFENVKVDFSGYTSFGVLALQECRKICYGEIASYAELAERVQKPKAYRAVGSILGRNRTPVVIPCHRIVGKDGKLHGFAGGLDLKAKLIRMEAKN